MSEAEKRLAKYLERENRVLTVKDKVLQVSEIAYFISIGRKVYAVDQAGKRAEINEIINSLEKRLKKTFVRTHRNYLVAIDSIESTSRRFRDQVAEASEPVRGVKDEATLYLSGLEDEIPVTETYSKRVQKALGIKNLHYVEPENPEDRRNRELGIIDFGWRELQNLSIKNKKSVEAYKEKWDIMRFSPEKMIEHFRMIDRPEVDKRKIFMNIIWQTQKWIKAGIQPEIGGNIRTLWYSIKRVLAHHEGIWEADDVSIFYGALQSMIEKEGLFKYKTFGFMDINKFFREIGKKRPEVIIAAEKAGFFGDISEWAKEIGGTFICLKGEPGNLTLEYFADELREKIGKKGLEIYCITDLNPAGYSIQNSLVEGLEVRQKLKVKKVVKMFHPGYYEDENAPLKFGTPVVMYKEIGDEIVPVPPANMSQVTRAINWIKEIKDQRFITKQKYGEETFVKIWGIESDCPKKEDLRQQFLKAVKS
jgi:hypothetical protein